MHLLLISATDIERLLPPDLLLEALAQGFQALTTDQIVAPPRNEVRIPERGSLLTMSAWQPDAPITTKLVSVFHGNHQLGLPSHHALICLFAADTGVPLAILDGTAITAIRTAGASALSVRLLARPSARVLTIIGAGVQGRAHLQYVAPICDFQEIRIASRSFPTAQQLADTSPNTIALESVERAVRGADVVCLCSSSDTPIIQYDWLAPGTHVTSVGYHPPGGELDRATIDQAHLFVETRLAFAPPPVGCVELANIDPTSATELGEVLLGQRSGRQSDQEVTVYKAMGHAMEDLIAANVVYQQALAHGKGQTIRW